MILSAEQLAAIEAEVSTSMENMMILWVDPEACLSAVVLPYDPVVKDLIELAFERGEAMDGVAGKAGGALANLTNGLIERDAEIHPKFFEPPEGDTNG